MFALEQDLIDSKMSSQEEAGIGGVSETLSVAFPVWVVDLHGLAWNLAEWPFKEHVELGILETY